MQDLIFYVAANETLGAVRDYANMRNESAPTLVLGVSVCLRMRLFTERNVATPYPFSAFSGIAAWSWSMDGVITTTKQKCFLPKQNASV